VIELKDILAEKFASKKRESTNTISLVFVRVLGCGSKGFRFAPCQLDNSGKKTTYCFLETFLFYSETKFLPLQKLRGAQAL
jgi:hypothetical protein